MVNKHNKYRIRRSRPLRRHFIIPSNYDVLLQDPTPADSFSARVETPTQDAQALFEKLFEVTPDATLLVNDRGVIVLANHQAETSFGYRKEELVGMAVEMLVPPEVREKHIEQRRRFQMNPRTRPMGAGLQLFARRKNGTSFAVDIILSPIQAADGLYTLCVIHDITLQVASQRALQEQAALVKLVQEISAAANEAASVQRLFQYAIDRLCEYLKWPVGHGWLTAPTGDPAAAHIWSSHIPPKMEPMRQATHEMRLAPGLGLPGTVLEIRQPIWITHPLDRPNFYRQEAALQAGIQTALAFPVLIGKEPVAVLEFFTDQVVEPQHNLLPILPNIGAQLGRVIERARAEENLRQRELQLHTLIANLPVILWMLDQHGRITMFEGKGISELGMQAGEIVGESISDPLENIPNLQTGVQQALQGQALHLECQAPSGVVFDAYFTPFRDVHGNVSGVVVMALDVSDRRRMEAELDEMRHHLMESVEIERLRLAQQLHDGPLQDLYGVFYQLQEMKNSLPEEARQAIETPLQTIENVNATLRFICGELRPTTLVHLGLKKAISSHIERLREQAPDLMMHLNLVDDAQSLEPGIRMGLFRIYQNLISNVIRHSQARHVWIRLYLTPETATLEVQDNGIGFQTPDNLIQLVRQGRFGLATALERAEALRGKFELKSRPGMGTLARVSVPRR